MVGITIFEFLSWLFDKLKTLRTSIEVWTTDLLVGESASYCKVWQRSDIGIEYVPICVDRLTHPTHTLQPTIHCHFGLSALDCRLLQVTESNNRLEKKRGKLNQYEKRTLFLQTYKVPQHPWVFSQSAWIFWNLHILPCQSKSSRTPLVPHDEDCYPVWSIAGFRRNREADFWMSKVWEDRKSVV